MTTTNLLIFQSSDSSSDVFVFFTLKAFIGKGFCEVFFRSHSRLIKANEFIPQDTTLQPLNIKKLQLVNVRNY